MSGHRGAHREASSSFGAGGPLNVVPDCRESEAELVAESGHRRGSGTAHATHLHASPPFHRPNHPDDARLSRVLGAWSYLGVSGVGSLASRWRGRKASRGRVIIEAVKRAERPKGQVDDRGGGGGFSGAFRREADAAAPLASTLARHLVLGNHHVFRTEDPSQDQNRRCVPQGPDENIADDIH